MRIGIDGRMIGDRMHGIARHTLNLLKEILKLDRENEYTLLITRKFAYRSEMAFNNLRYMYMKSPFASLFEPMELYTVLKRERFDLYHSPSFIPPFYSGSLFFMTLHDLNHLTHSDLRQRLYYRFIIAPYVNKAKKIVTVSEFSKKKICKTFNLAEDKVAVIYNGVENRFRPVQEEGYIAKLKERYGIPDKFILGIGSEKSHKNLKGLIRALKGIDKDYALVLNISSSSIREKDLIDSSLKERVHLIGYIEDNDMPYIYNAASVFAFISLTEGFGLPALEAMACGCPSVVSNTASLPEVCGDAVYYVDPGNKDGITEGINSVLRDLDLRNSLIQKGLERAKLFTWEAAARKMLALFNEGGRNS